MNSSLLDELWSGLSESNRHLNLGKVPYYHYTKAAQRLSFYSMPERQRQALTACAVEKPNTKNLECSGDLRNARGLHHRRAPLALREARGFVLVRIDAAELLAVGIIDTHEKVVVFAPAVGAKGSLAFSGTFFRRGFCHVGHPCRWRISTTLSQGSNCRTSTGEDSIARFITTENRANWNGNHYRLTGEITVSDCQTAVRDSSNSGGADGSNEGPPWHIQ